MSTAAPERVPPADVPPDPNREQPAEPAPPGGVRDMAPDEGKRKTEDEQKEDETPDEQDDRYELPVGFQGNQLRNNNGLALANFGSVHIGTGSEPLAVDGPVADQQLRDSREVFVPPPELPEAWRRLDKRNVVVLCGCGTGRSLTGVNLLQQLELTELLHLNAERSIETIPPGNLSPRTGYLWNGSQFRHEQRLTGGRLSQLSRQYAAVHSKLVIIIDDRADLPGDAQEFAVLLTAPRPVKVVRRHLARQGVYFDALPENLRVEVRRVLVDGSPPEQSVQMAADLASMDARGLLTEGGLPELRNSAAQSVLTWFRSSQSIAARALMIAVAVFENRSSAEVFAAALDLERLLANPEHLAYWPATPPDLFADTRDLRIEAIGADVEEVAGRTGALDPKVVRFRQPARAASVLHCVWWQYDRIRPTLKEWLGERTVHEGAHMAGARVFGNLLSATRGPDPTEELASWAQDKAVRRRDMAVAALDSMAEHSHLVPLVRRRLARWSDPRSRLQLRLTAAKAYGGSFGRRYPNLAMSRFQVMTENPDDELNEMVSQGINELATEPANRTLVCAELLKWTTQRDNELLRNIALVSSLQVVGLMESDAVSAAPHQRNVARDQRSIRYIGPIVDKLLANLQTAPQVVRGLDTWASRAEVRPDLGEGLRVVLREIFTNTTPETRKRISFDLRRFVFDARENATALRTAVLETLEGIDDQDE